MPLRDLDELNIQEDLDNGVIDNFYADRLREVIAELTANWGWGGVMINGNDGNPCGECEIRIYYQSPRPGNYSDWVWIEILRVRDCNLWVHINYLLAQQRWGWSIWKNGEFPGGVRNIGFNMPPDFVDGTVYSTPNVHGTLNAVFNDICRLMPDLCRCMLLG